MQEKAYDTILHRFPDTEATQLRIFAIFEKIEKTGSTELILVKIVD